MVKGDVIYIKECGFFDSFSSGGCGQCSKLKPS